MNKFLAFVQGHYQALIFSLLVLILGWSIGSSVWKVAFPKAAGMTEDVIEALVGDVIDKRVAPMEESLVRIEEALRKEVEFPVSILVLEMNRFSTPKEVDDRVDIWESQVWGVQLAAMKYVSEHKDAQERLRDMIIYDDVYLAFMKRAMVY
jgi:hypothetical protein